MLRRSFIKAIGSIPFFGWFSKPKSNAIFLTHEQMAQEIVSCKHDCELIADGKYLCLRHIDSVLGASMMGYDLKKASKGSNLYVESINKYSKYGSGYHYDISNPSIKMIRCQVAGKVFQTNDAEDYWIREDNGWKRLV